jgi:fibronectin type 3 domain-containing protein
VWIDPSQYDASQIFNSRVTICNPGCWPTPLSVAYLLRSSVANGTYKLAIAGISSGTGANVQVWLDNKLVGLLTFPTTGSPVNATTVINIATAGFHTLSLSTNTTTGHTVIQGPHSISFTLASGSGSALVPSAPFNVRGTTLANGASLQWEHVTTATGYIIQRGQVSGGPYTSIAKVQDESYVDSGLQNDQIYYYTVVAVNSAGNSALSPQIAIVPVQQVVPAQPQVKASAGLQHGSAPYQLGQVFLQWPAVPNAQSYHVKRTAPSATDFGTFTGTVLFDAELTPGATCTYTVLATNNKGSSNTTTVTIQVPSTSVPGTPTSLVLTATSTGPFLKWLQPMWTYPEFAELFVVQRAPASSTSFVTIGYPSANSFTDVTAGTGKFCYRVYANSGSGMGSTPSNVACN